MTGTIMHDATVSGGAHVASVSGSAAPTPTVPAQRRNPPHTPSRQAAGPGWRLNVLGPVELCYDSQPVAVTGVIRTLLVLLARAAGDEVSTTSIIAGIWGSNVPEDAENTVASYVSRLRKELTAVAPDEDPTRVVVTMPAGYILDVAAPNVDVAAFERLVGDGQRALAAGQPRLAIARIDAALLLWRGEAYEDVRDQSFARTEAARLDDLRLAALELRVEALLAVTAPTAPESLVAELDTLVAEHWHRERLWAALMTTLYRLGRRSEALAAHRQAHVRLAKGLGAELGPELRAAERAVLAHDPALLGVPLAATTVPVDIAATAPVCVGRDEEVDWLESALDLAATRRAQARLIVGSPGIGKTRLVSEVARRAAGRGVVVRYGRADADDCSAALVAERDRLSLVIIDDLDLATHDDLSTVVYFVRSTLNLPVLTLLTCRDAVRVGELARLPKLVMTALDDAAVAEIVRTYAPATVDATAAAAMVNAGGVPARLHRAASEWAFARAGRRIDRAAEAAAEPRRWLASVRAEVRAGVLELAHVRAQARHLRPAPSRVEAPYKGLARYEATDADIFHGREQTIADLVARIVEAPLLAVVGAAGSGKSSLVRAGLLPALAAGVLPDSASWRQLVVTPTSAGSLAELLDAARRPLLADGSGSVAAGLDESGDGVAAPAAGPSASAPGPSASATRPALDAATETGSGIGSGGGGVPIDGFVRDGDCAPDAGSAPVSGAVLVNGAVPDGSVVTGETVAHDGRLAGDESAPAVVPGPVHATVLLVLDQFEEAFTDLDTEDREAFLTAVVEAAQANRVVLTMRSDFFPRCAEHAELSRLVEANTFLMRPMSDDEIRHAVERPAALAEVGLEEGLTEALIGDARKVPHPLPHLSIALWSMWQRRALTLAGYQTLGELTHAIDEFAEAAYAALASAAEREAARRMVLRLVGEAYGIPVRRRVALVALLDEAGPRGSAALETLADHGLVRIDDDVAQLGHDVVLTGWFRLRAWLDDAAAEVGLRDHLARSAAAWAASGSGRAGLYDGVRLAAAAEWVDAHPSDVDAIEREFLAASGQIALAAEMRRRRRVTTLWRWLIALALALVVTISVSGVSVVRLGKAEGRSQHADAARLAALANGEPDLRLGMLLAVAATRLDPEVAESIRVVLMRRPDLAGTAGSAVTAIALSPDGATIAVATSAGTVSIVGIDLISLPGVSAVRHLERTDHGGIVGLQFTPDGRRLVGWGSGASAQGAAGIVIWDVGTAAAVGPSFGQVSAGAAGALLADGRTLLLSQGGQHERTTVAWSLDSRTPSTAYQLPVTAADGLAVSPDGRRLAWGLADGVLVIEPATGGTRTIQGAGRPAALSPDGRRLLTIDADVLTVWSLESGARAGEARRHSADILGADWSADGRAFASVDADGLIVVWDARTLRPTKVLTGSSVPARVVRFALDGRTLFTVGDDGALLVWDLTGTRGVGAKLAGGTDPASLVGLACALAGRDMTRTEWETYVPDRPYLHVCPR